MKAAKERNELQIIQSDLLNAIKVGYEHKNILKVQKWNRTRNRSSRISPPFTLILSSFHPYSGVYLIRILSSSQSQSEDMLPFSE